MVADHQGGERQIGVRRLCRSVSGWQNSHADRVRGLDHHKCRLIDCHRPTLSPSRGTGVGNWIIETSLLLAYERPRAISHLVATLTGVLKKVV